MVRYMNSITLLNNMTIMMTQYFEIVLYNLYA